MPWKIAHLHSGNADAVPCTAILSVKGPLEDSVKPELSAAFSRTLRCLDGNKFTPKFFVPVPVSASVVQVSGGDIRAIPPP